MTEILPDTLKEFRQWIQAQPHLKARIDDPFLVQFLRNCNNDLEKAKEKFDNYYALKSKYPKYFAATSVDYAKFRSTYNQGCFVALPTPLNECGPRIFVFRFKYSLDHQGIEDIFLPAIAQLEVMMMNDPYTSRHGAIFITDLSNATVNHLLQITPTYLQPLLTFLERALPVYIQSYCYINAPNYSAKFLEVLRSCMPEKLRNRLFVYGHNNAALNDQVPLKYLPTDLGGDNGCLDQICLEYNKVWDEQKDRFKQNANYGTDESRRPGGPKQYASQFGIGGSFEKLNVD